MAELGAATLSSLHGLLLLFNLLSTAPMISLAGGASNPIGVNYGRFGNNLPSPPQVAKLVQSTSIGKVKLYDADPSTLAAFAHTGVQLVVGIGNDDVLGLLKEEDALDWVKNNVATYMPATQIVAIAVGNEVLSTGDRFLISHLLRAMMNLYAALASLGLDSQVKVSSPHSLAVLSSSVPPSAAVFRSRFTKSVLPAILGFLANTSAPFMANAYPYFGYLGDPDPNALGYALFNSSVGYTDPRTNLHYTNMFDAQVDAVYSAMAALGFSNVDVVVSETGWPSLGDPNERGASLVNAQTYNNNLIRHILSNRGTPLRPNRPIVSYIFALFNEDLKPGPTSERNYGLFTPDMTPVYSTVVSKDQVLKSLPSRASSSPSPSPLPVSTAGAPSTLRRPSLVLMVLSSVAYLYCCCFCCRIPQGTRARKDGVWPNLEPIQLSCSGI